MTRATKVLLVGSVTLAAFGATFEQGGLRGRLRGQRSVAGENPIAASRLPNNTTTLPNPVWASAGAGTIPTYTVTQTVGDAADELADVQTLTAAALQTALNACGDDEAVLMQPGTYTMNAMVTIPSRCVLRGSGPHLTKLSFTGAGSCISGVTSNICFTGPNVDLSGCCDGNEADWTGGFTQGTTSVTLGPNDVGSGSPQVGGVLYLDAPRDSDFSADDEWPEVFECLRESAGTTGCTHGGGGSHSGHEDYNKSQTFKITSVSGSAGAGWTVGVTPPLSMPSHYWDATGRRAVWVSTTFTQDAGLEDIWVDTNQNAVRYTVTIQWSTDIWVKNSQITNDGEVDGNSDNPSLIKAQWSSHVTVRDSYLFGGQEANAEDIYGFSCRIGGNMLIENNIIQFMRVPIVGEQCQNVVKGYNYAFRVITDDGSGWNFSGIGDNHASGGNHLLWESNDGSMINMENYSGNGQFMTALRNNLSGTEESGVDASQTPTFKIYAYNRFANLLGNVLGLTGYHVVYEHNTGDTGSGASGCRYSIYSIGHGGNCGIGGTSPFPTDDQETEDSTFRWGNWDVVTSTSDNGSNDTTGIKWASGEVPSGIAGNYANPLPGAQAVPNSMYLSAKPSFFGARAWPAIGPDVSSGELANRGGHANKIPARACFEALGGARTDSTAVAFTGWKIGVCAF